MNNIIAALGILAVIFFVGGAVEQGQIISNSDIDSQLAQAKDGAEDKGEDQKAEDSKEEEKAEESKDEEKSEDSDDSKEESKSDEEKAEDSAEEKKEESSDDDKVEEEKKEEESKEESKDEDSKEEESKDEEKSDPITFSSADVSSPSDSKVNIGFTFIQGEDGDHWLEYGTDKDKLENSSSIQSGKPADKYYVTISVACGSTYYVRGAVKTSEAIYYTDAQSLDASSCEEEEKEEEAKDAISWALLSANSVEDDVADVYIAYTLGQAGDHWIEYGIEADSLSNSTKIAAAKAEEKVTTTVEGMTCGTKYFFRAVLKNDSGTSYTDTKDVEIGSCESEDESEEKEEEGDNKKEDSDDSEVSVSASEDKVFLDSWKTASNGKTWEMSVAFKQRITGTHWLDYKTDDEEGWTSTTAQKLKDENYYVIEQAGLACDTKYHIRVAVQDADSTTHYSETQDFETKECGFTDTVSSFRESSGTAGLTKIKSFLSSFKGLTQSATGGDSSDGGESKAGENADGSSEGGFTHGDANAVKAGAIKSEIKGLESKLNSISESGGGNDADVAAIKSEISKLQGHLSTIGGSTVGPNGEGGEFGGEGSHTAPADGQGPGFGPAGEGSSATGGEGGNTQGGQQTSSPAGEGGSSDGQSSPTRVVVDNAPAEVREQEAKALLTKQVVVRGNSGDYVKGLQRYLNSQGSVLNVDGIFGPLTERAVRQFQADYGLTVDGVVGPQTLSTFQAVTQ